MGAKELDKKGAQSRSERKRLSREKIIAASLKLIKENLSLIHI